MANDQYPDKKEMSRRRKEDFSFSDQARLSETGALVHGSAASRTARPERNSAQLSRLARRLGVEPDDLARKIPADTLRRLRWPLLEQRGPDGERIFKHDSGIVEGITSLVSSDRGEQGERTPAPRERDSEGKFISRS